MINTNRVSLRLFFLALLFSLSLGGFQAAGQTLDSPHLGINFAGPADWNTELLFADLFRLSRSWILQLDDL